MNMDLERLNIDEVRQLSKLIDLLGTPVAIPDMTSCINVLEAATTIYRRTRDILQEASRSHGEG